MSDVQVQMLATFVAAKQQTHSIVCITQHTKQVKVLHKVQC